MKRVSRTTAKKSTMKRTSKRPTKFAVATVETPQEADISDTDNELSVSTPIISSTTI